MIWEFWEGAARAVRWRHVWYLLYEAEKHSVDQNVLERNQVPPVFILFAFSC